LVNQMDVPAQVGVDERRFRMKATIGH
jgi:hypothetical protein